MGFRDYYRQFEEMTPEEVSAQLKEVSEERHRHALTIVQPLDLSQETGELTPALKVKRNVVNEKYAPLFDELYS